MSPHASVPIDRLLAQREWVRRVARAMVHDENDADDLEQALWLEVLQHPPRGVRSLRGWIATALRRDRYDSRRAAESRAHRESVVAPAETLPSAEELVAKADALKRVVVAVMDLTEPYRSTILYRFFEDLPPSAIAERQGVPVETVRTRLKRALAQLRSRFDAESEGDRERWCLALIPLLRRTSPCGAAGASAVSTAGVLLMGLKTKIAVAAGLLLLLAGAVALWPASRPRGDAPSPVGPGTPTRTAALRARVRPAETSAAEEEQSVAAAVSAASRSAKLRGNVTDEETKQPVVGARVSIVGESADAPRPATFAMTDASGRFDLDVPLGRVLVRAQAEGWYQPFFPYEAGEIDLWRHGVRSFDRNTVVVTADNAPTIDILLARTGGVEGQVLFVDGTPVPEAALIVRTATPGARSTPGGAGADGRFRILGVPPGPKLWIEASKPGLVTAIPAETAVGVARVTSGVVVRMRRPPVVTGRLTSAGGKPLAGASVQVMVVTDNRAVQWGPNGEWLAWSDAPHSPAGADGTYEVPVWPVHGEFVVRATCPGHQPARSATVRYSDDRDVYRVDLTLSDGAALGGRVTAEDTGAGIAGALVFAGPATNPLAKVAAPLRAVCDADGRFAFDSPPPDTYLVSASAPGYVDGRIPPVTTPCENVLLALAPAMSISGAVRLGGRALAGALVGVQPQDDGALELFDYYVNPFAGTATTAEDGSFRVLGLAAGMYRLHVRPSAGAIFRAAFSASVAAGSDGVVVDVEPLAAGETIDPYASMSDHDLGCSAAGLNLQREYDAALEKWKSLLARPLTRNERATALTEYANTLGNLGRRDEQDAALREAIDLAGPGTTRGLTALSRLAWSRYWAGDARAALDLIGPVTVCDDVVQAAGARWSSAKFAAKLGDVTAARATLTTLRAEVAGSKDSRVRRLLPQIDKSLAEMPER